MRLVVLIVAAAALFASDMGEVYRKEGVGAVAARLENELVSEDYWRDHMAKVETSFGFFDQERDIIVVSKARHEAMLWHYRGGNLSFDSRYQVMLGKNNGAKTRVGDRKTPIGSYRIVRKMPKVDPFYGPLALVTEYPNLLDTLEGRDGSGIWIHGLPLNGVVRDDNTRGCIALDNGNLVNLDTRIDSDKTRLIIFEGEIKKTPKEDLILIMTTLYQWRKAWAESNLEAYLAFYDDDFRRFDGMRKAAFTEYKRRVFGKNEEKEIIFHNFEITPNPSLDGSRIYKVNFYEEYRAPSYNFSGLKELYVRVADGQVLIIAER